MVSFKLHTNVEQAKDINLKRALHRDREMNGVKDNSSPLDW